MLFPFYIPNCPDTSAQPVRGLSTRMNTNSAMATSQESNMMQTKPNLFSKILTALARKTGRIFLVESYPIFSDDKGQDQAKRTVSLSDAHVPEGNITQKSIIEIANKFDYDCRFQGKIVILQKRYSHPEDIPDVTYAEAEACLNNFIRVSANFHTKGAIGNQANTLIMQLVSSLSSEQQYAAAQGYQQDQLKTDQGGIQISGLPQEQQILLQRALVDTKIDGPLYALEINAGLFHDIRTNNSTLSWFEQNGKPLYGISVPR